MEFQVYRCTQCGAPELKQLDEGTFKCAYCGTVLRRKKLEEDAKKLSELLEEQTREINERLERIKNNQSSEIEGIRLELAQEKRRRVQEKLDNISNMRKNLYEAIVAEFASNEQIKIRAEKLKDIVPDDFLANFFITAIENDDKAICELIRAVDVEKNYEDIALIITFLIKSLQPSFMLDLCNLIERAYKNTNLEMFEKYSTKFSKEAEKIKQGIYEVALPRDVFVAYSSKDMDKVVELVDVLEKQGLECFVAARNLKHGKGAVENYGSALQEAMYNCKCFVFVSSLNSRSTACDAIKIEIPNIKKLDISNAPPKMRNNYAAIPHEYKKHRVEYRIEESRGFNVADRITNEFFEGYERVYSPEEVAERVLKQITEVHEEFKPQEMPLYSKSPIVQSEVSSNSSDVEGLIQRAVGLLERGDFSYADELFKRVLDKTGDANAEAYLGRLMVDLKARTENELVNLADPFDGHTYFKRAYMYADAQCRKRLQAYVAQSKQNRERIRKDSIYDAAISIATFSHTIEKYEEAISKLSSIHPWKDSGAKMLEYRSEIESIKTQDENKRKNDIYERARSLMRGSNIVDISEAIRLFCTISDWKDSKIRIKDCEQFIEQEAIERKNNTYSRACSMMNGNDPESYKEAIKLFERIRSWKDSSSRINQCHERIKYLSEKKEYDRKKAMYDKAVSLMYLNDFPDHILVRKCEEALELFDQIKGFEDTSIKSIDCKNRIESLRERIEKRRQKEELTKRIKKITKVAVVVGAVLLVAVVVFVGLPQWTYNSGYYTYYITLNGITEFEVPEGSAVINKGAFQGSLTLEKVTIPGTVKTIGDESFRGCKKLHTVVVEDGVETIGIQAFEDCYELKTVYLPRSLKTISNSAFYFTELEDVYFAGTEEEWNNISIGSRNSKLLNARMHFNNSNAGNEEVNTESDVEETTQVSSAKLYSQAIDLFDNGYFSSALDIFNTISGYEDSKDYIKTCKQCLDLSYHLNDDGEGYSIIGGALEYTKVVFPSKYEGLPVTEINKRAYYYKHPSFTEIIISDGIESIGVDAFYACKNLRSVVMGNGVLSIGTSAFSGCSSLQTVVLSEDLQSIGNYAFKSCISLRQIDIPNNVISIKYSSFANTGITRIIIPESVLIIEHATFSSCSNLVSITLPSGITSISYDAFRGCSNLSIVNYCGSEEQWKLIDISDNGNYPLNDATIVYNYDPAGELGDQTTEESTKIDTSVETNDVEETPTAGETETGISE